MSEIQRINKVTLQGMNMLFYGFTNGVPEDHVVMVLDMTDVDATELLAGIAETNASYRITNAILNSAEELIKQKHTEGMIRGLAAMTALLDSEMHYG